MLSPGSMAHSSFIPEWINGDQFNLLNGTQHIAREIMSKKYVKRISCFHPMSEKYLPSNFVLIGLFNSQSVMCYTLMVFI